MIGKHNQAVVRPRVQDIMSQAAAYGATIPLIFGTVLEPPLMTWLNGIVKSSGKKSGKKGNSTYACQIDLMLGHNPIQTTLRCWANGPSVGLGLGNNKVSTGNVSSYTVSDPLFYCVVGVTATIGYSYSFNDYGSAAPSSGSGSYEIPLWNAALQGPDPTNAGAYRWAPYTYYCLPGSATVSQMHVPGASAINVYYATLANAGWGAGQIPIAKVLRLAFESSLGEGPEYASPRNFTAQQIIYPMFAGAGSSTFDLGPGTAPQMKIEVVGSHTLYPTGYGTAIGTHQPTPAVGADADYADMIEAILKQGINQGALLSTGSGTATGQTPIQTGCSSFDFPGPTQKKFWSPDLGSFSGSISYDLPITVGDVLVVAVASTPPGSPFTIADLLPGAWNTVINSGGAGFWYKQATAAGSDTITLGNVPTSADVQIFALSGGDTVDFASLFSASSASLPSGKVTATVTPTQQEYILAWVFPDTAGNTGSGNYPFWKPTVPSTGQGGNYYKVGPHNSFTVGRVVTQPSIYSFTGDVATSTWNLVLLGIKNSVAPAYPRAFAQLLDTDTLNLCRLQCRANGLWGSLLMNSQKKAADWLKDIYDAADTAPVWSGFRLKSVPRSEVSAFGNGAVYTSPTAAGPLFDLTPDDMVGDSSKPLVTVTRKSVTDRPALQRLQFLDRDNQYRAGTISQPDPGTLVLYGLRYATPRAFEMIQSVSVAQAILGIMVRRTTQLVNDYEFTLQARYKLLESMALITITDPLLGLSKLPVRLTSVEEDDQYNLKCTAEDFYYGTNAPHPVNVSASASPIPATQTTPANVNSPVFLEPPGALTGVAQPQLWIGVSAPDTQYGGSAVYVSVDGGTTYNPLADESGNTTVVGNAVTGHNTADWPQALDPDTTNDLLLDLSESFGSLSQYTVSEEDQFLFPCYIAGSGVYPFEIMTYAVATLTGANTYTLKATGVGNKLRRAVFGTWASSSTPNTGSDHPMNSRFLFLDPSDNGIFKVNVPSSWVGKTLFFKFVQFNIYGGGASTLSAATAYSYTVVGSQNGPGGGSGGSGGGSGSSYTINPANPLTQNATTNIHMANVVASWTPSGLQTFYAARNFTIPAPSAPLTYYVTVYDPNQTGDLGTGATLTAFCQNTAAAAHVGQAGYVYMGSILANAAGTGSGGGGGGSNPSVSTAVQIPIPSTTRGDFSIAHGLGTTPQDVDIKIQSDGLIRFQSPTMWDATNVYLNASDDGLIGTLVIEL